VRWAAAIPLLLWASASVAQDEAPRPVPRDTAPTQVTQIDPMAPHAPGFALSRVVDDTPRPLERPFAGVDVSASVARPLLRPGAVLPESAPATRGPALAASLVPVPRPLPAAEVAGEPRPEAELEGPVGTHELTIRGGLFGGGTRVLTVPAYSDDGATAVLLSPLPELRPDGLEARVRAAATQSTPARVTQLGIRGQLCGSAGIFGERLEPITGRISGCGIPEPVRVREVDGITLSTPATINCNTALALQDWLGDARDIVGRTGGGISSIRVVASYSCRTRNNQPGARLSEHSTGNGIDIAGIGLQNGQELTLLSGWRDSTEGPIWRQLHAAACGPFGTVLGPESDRFHQDHFHFDVADYRSGPYCR